MSLSINQVVNAQIAPVPMAAARRDLSMVALFTPETGQTFTDGKTRYVTVSSAQDVANLFGSGSSVYKAAQALFSVRPKPNKAIVARWAKEKQVIPAVASALKGGTLSVGTDTFKRITDGAFSLMVDGKAVVIGSLDFSSAADLQGVASIIAVAIPKTAVFSSLWDETGKRIIFQAKKAGAQGAPTFGYAIKQDAGTYIGDLLKLEDGQASRIVGQDAAEVAQETPAEALGKLENTFQNWYGAYFADALTDEKLMNAHDWIASAPTSKVLAFTALRDEQLAWDNTNTLKILAEKNSGRLMVQYNKTGDDHAAASLLGIALSTHWNAINSAKTVKFKQQNTVQSDDRIVSAP